MRVYHFINDRYGLEGLQEKRLKIARINELNDPFEFVGADLSDYEFREAMEDLKDHLNKKLGLLCFSKGWENPVQWTHYADKHRGICMGFDVPDNYLAVMKYEDNRLSTKDFFAGLINLRDKLSAEMNDFIGQSLSIRDRLERKNKFMNELFPKRLWEENEADTEGLECMKKILCTKFSHWSYEQEYRIFCPLSEDKKNGDLYYLDFPDELRLKEVIIGVRSCVTTNHIKALLGEMVGSVEVFKVREAYRKFAMVKDGSNASYV